MSDSQYSMKVGILPRNPYYDCEFNGQQEHAGRKDFPGPHGFGCCHGCGHAGPSIKAFAPEYSCIVPAKVVGLEYGKVSGKVQAKIQQLWGFNLGYEHHEQKPIAFGAVAPAAAKQMQLWGWDMGSQMDGKVPLPMGAMPAAKQAKKQQLVGFNLGYEHHEQMPIPFGIKKNGRKTQLVKVDSYDSEAEENMDPALGRGSDQHVLKDGLWIKPEFKNTDDNYALRTLQGKGEAR